MLNFKMKIKRFLSVFIWMCVYLGMYVINIIYSISKWHEQN